MQSTIYRLFFLMSVWLACDVHAESFVIFSPFSPIFSLNNGSVSPVQVSSPSYIAPEGFNVEIDQKNFKSLSHKNNVASVEGNSKTITPFSFNPLISLIGGVANIDANHSQSFTGTDGQQFSYTARGNDTTAGLIGVFLGEEAHLFSSGLFIQFGLEYNYFGSAIVHGYTQVGIEPATDTFYSSQFEVQSQQWLLLGKLYATAALQIPIRQVFYPYISLGVGAAFNHANDFSTTTAEGQGEGVNLTPVFSNNHRGSFSYSVGLGVDTEVREHTRLGMGYRFADFGQASLGQGNIGINDYSAPVPFTLKISNLYANQFILQISHIY